ncbi:MAG: ATP synthase F1 subunit gamma [Mycoplasmatales bacterium]
MPTVTQTKARLNSVESTQKVIKAMELVASSKIKKSRELAKATDPLFTAIIQSINALCEYQEIEKSLFQNPQANKTLYFVISSDMGLCGGYNANVGKFFLQNIAKNLEQDMEYEVIAVGKKVISKLEFEGFTVAHKFTNYSVRSEYELATEISDVILEKIISGSISNIKVIYTKYINPLRQEVELVDLNELFKARLESTVHELPQELSIEPESQVVLEMFINLYIRGIVYSTMLESFASEHANRRMAMEAANKNSLELMEHLRLEMNRIRQALITQEISEIVGGSEALNEE